MISRFQFCQGLFDEVENLFFTLFPDFFFTIDFGFDPIDKVSEHFVDGGFTFLPAFFFLSMSLIDFAKVLTDRLDVFIIGLFAFKGLILDELV